MPIIPRKRYALLKADPWVGRVTTFSVQCLGCKTKVRSLHRKRFKYPLSDLGAHKALCRAISISKEAGQDSEAIDGNVDVAAKHDWELEGWSYPPLQWIITDESSFVMSKEVTPMSTDDELQEEDLEGTPKERRQDKHQTDKIPSEYMHVFRNYDPRRYAPYPPRVAAHLRESSPSTLTLRPAQFTDEERRAFHGGSGPSSQDLDQGTLPRDELAGFDLPQEGNHYKKTSLSNLLHSSNVCPFWRYRVDKEGQSESAGSSKLGVLS
ncbi:hypothetical protein D9615_010230 [Tricholomella constricta]|uniref:Uncharacterized protein n=1 Tax=Tricholomella constricta TaxID=117010 RepID=A0A8H5GRG9_9AGAR|nr:hypothetical protein D9615_010230 [Tricholomella constricta]